MPALDLLMRVGLATLLGIAIGMERQWRSRMAGLQTGIRSARWSTHDEAATDWIGRDS